MSATNRGNSRGKDSLREIVAGFIEHVYLSGVRQEVGQPGANTQPSTTLISLSHA